MKGKKPVTYDPAPEETTGLVKAGAYVLPKRLQVQESYDVGDLTIVIESTKARSRVVSVSITAHGNGSVDSLELTSQEQIREAARAALATWINVHAYSVGELQVRELQAHWQKVWRWTLDRFGHVTQREWLLQTWEAEYESAGKTQKQMAKELGVPYETVRNYLSRARKDRYRAQTKGMGK